jgi:hypothetical protein
VLIAELDAIAENGRAVGIEPPKTLKPLPLSGFHRRTALKRQRENRLARLAN